MAACGVLLGATGIDLDLMSAVAAPAVDDAPVCRGMLLAQLNPFSTDEHYTEIREGHPTPGVVGEAFEVQGPNTSRPSRSVRTGDERGTQVASSS